jgi:hypothetical protein
MYAAKSAGKRPAPSVSLRRDAAGAAIMAA